MENFRSMSCREGRMQFGGGGNKVHPPTNMQDLRSYSTNTYAAAAAANNSNQQMGKQEMSNKQVKKSKSYVNNGGGGSSKGWSFSDPEIQRKKRVASYKVYAVEGKMKGSFKKSFRWIKNTCTHVVHGLW